METSGWQKVNQVLGSLRVGKIGEQCENIVKLPSIFEEYPFPILIDAVFLKLGDIFRECNSNFIRFCILKVVLSTTEHHSKITGQDIFLRPVLSVIHSNDAVARAVTLRVLGVSASLFPERKNVLHSIVRSLDSHMELERDAALFACKKYAAQSQDVCKTVVPKLEELLTSLSTTEPLKVKILDVFQWMNYDLETSYQVRLLCLKLLEDQAPERITDGCLKTLTQMVLSTLSSPREVIDLLLDVASHETRRVVRNSALKCLENVAGVQPELFSAADLQILFKLTHDSASGSDIIRKISISPANHILSPDLLNSLCDKLNTVPLASAVSIYQICANMLPTKNSQIHFSPLLVRTISSHDTGLVRRLLLSFSRQQFVNTSLLFSLLTNSSPDIFIELCYCLSSLKRYITLEAGQVNAIFSECGVEKGCYFSKLLLVLYSGCEGYELKRLVVDSLTNFVEVLVKDDKQWAMYCIARVAMCHGVYEVAGKIVKMLQVVHPYTRNFFSALEMICCGELAGRSNLAEAISMFEQALTYVKCCNNTPLTHFQSHFLLLRLRLLKICLQLGNLCNIAAMNSTDRTEDFKPTLHFISRNLDDLHGSVRELESQMIDAKPGDNIREMLAVCDVLSVLCSGEMKNVPLIAGNSPIFTECNKTVGVINGKPGVLSSISFIKQTVNNFVSHKFNMPLFFFVQEHSTSVSIATNPQIEQGIIKIAGGCNLLLTIEAVVRGNSSRIKSMLVSVTCEKAKSQSKGGDELPLTLYDSEVGVVKGYLKLELSVEVHSFADVYTIDAKAVDFHDAVWNVGYTGAFRVKCDDSVLSKSQMAKSYV